MQNDENVQPKLESDSTPDNTRHVLKKVKKHVFPAEGELLEFINFHDPLVLIKSLEWVHNTALYHSYLNLETEEKSFLFNIKLLMNKLDAIVQKTSV